MYTNAYPQDESRKIGTRVIDCDFGDTSPGTVDLGLHYAGIHKPSQWCKVSTAIMKSLTNVRCPRRILSDLGNLEPPAAFLLFSALALLPLRRLMSSSRACMSDTRIASGITGPSGERSPLLLPVASSSSPLAAAHDGAKEGVDDIQLSNRLQL